MDVNGRMTICHCISETGLASAGLLTCEKPLQRPAAGCKARPTRLRFLGNGSWSFR